MNRLPLTLAELNARLASAGERLELTNGEVQRAVVAQLPLYHVESTTGITLKVLTRRLLAVVRPTRVKAALQQLESDRVAVSRWRPETSTRMWWARNPTVSMT